MRAPVAAAGRRQQRALGLRSPTLTAQLPPRPPPEVTSCPHCNRKLLSKRSILCNWCGKRIDDAEYLERAAQERAQEDARMREQVDKELQETAKMGIIGRLTRRKKELKREPNLLIPPPDL